MKPILALADQADVITTIHDALASHATAGYIVAGIAAVALLVPIVLKALGKSIPLVDVAIDLVLNVAKSFLPKPKPADVAGTPEQKAAEAAQPGTKVVGDVTNISDFKKDKDA